MLGIRKSKSFSDGFLLRLVGWGYFGCCVGDGENIGGVTTHTIYIPKGGRGEGKSGRPFHHTRDSYIVGRPVVSSKVVMCRNNGISYDSRGLITSSS